MKTAYNKQQKVIYCFFLFYCEFNDRGRMFLVVNVSIEVMTENKWYQTFKSGKGTFLNRNRLNNTVVE